MSSDQSHLHHDGEQRLVSDAFDFSCFGARYFILIPLHGRDATRCDAMLQPSHPCFSFAWKECL
jgi:hypothetical protein